MPSTFFLRHVSIKIETLDSELAILIDNIWASFASTSSHSTDISIFLHRTNFLPSVALSSTCTVLSSANLTHFVDKQRVIINFLPWSQVDIDFSQNCLDVYLTPECFQYSSIIEDVLILGLAPLLRRHQLFPLHAFSASLNGRAILLVGQSGAGKTTSGISLLLNNWGLIANDNPLLYSNNEQVFLTAYPGFLSAFDDSLARFPTLSHITKNPQRFNDHKPLKRVFSAESIGSFSGWVYESTPSAICFLEFDSNLKHCKVARLSTRDSLLSLVPHSMELWDTEMMQEQLTVLGRLVEHAPGYRLSLSPEISELPALLTSLVS